MERRALLNLQALYKRKAGEEIVGQMYAFTDQEGAEVGIFELAELHA